MKKSQLFLALILFASTFLFTACITEGCIDKDAVNYNADADRSDGSCEFEGRAVFWYSKASSDEYVYFNTNTLFFYVDETLIGSVAASFYWNSAPECDAVGSISVKRLMADLKSQSATYLVVDEDGFEWDKGTFRFTANTCKQIQLK